MAAARISADRWPDHIRLSFVEPGFVCTATNACGIAASACRVGEAVPELQLGAIAITFYDSKKI